MGRVYPYSAFTVAAPALAAAMNQLPSIDNVAVSGRVVVISRSGGIVSSYDCCSCPCPDDFANLSIDPTSFVGVPGDLYSAAGLAWYDDCNSNSYSVDDTSNMTWSTTNTSVATASVGEVDLLAGGSCTVKVGNFSDCVYDLTPCACDMTPGNGSAACIVVQITGSSVVWWFNGQAPSGYTTRLTLTAIPAGGTSYGWSIVAGTDKAVISGYPSANQAYVEGTDLSTSQGDVTVQCQVRASGLTGIASIDITVRGPYKLVPGSNFYSTDPNFGYDTKLYYTIQDNMNADMPSAVGFVEQWTTSMDNSPYPSNNWAGPPATGDTTSNSEFYDHITGPGLGNNPPPVPTPIGPGQQGLSNVLVQQRGQEWTVGSTVPGLGARVQTDTFQRFVDHGHHANITSPAP